VLFFFLVGSWVWDLSFWLTVLVSVWVSGFTPLGLGSLLGYLTVVFLEGIRLYRWLVPTNGVIWSLTLTADQPDSDSDSSHSDSSHSDSSHSDSSHSDSSHSDSSHSDSSHSDSSHFDSSHSDNSRSDRSPLTTIRQPLWQGLSKECAMTMLGGQKVFIISHCEISIGKCCSSISPSNYSTVQATLNDGCGTCWNHIERTPWS